MKVICKCCHKSFDYDMYMGLCPKCGRVYRRGIAHYSTVEKDMLGDFHVHVDEGGLNRGISGVVYNNGTVSEKQILNSASKATVNKELMDTVNNSVPGSVVNTTAVKSLVSNPPSFEKTVSDPISNIPLVTNQGVSNSQSFYGATHKTRMNQGVTPQKKNPMKAVKGIFLLIIIIKIIQMILS